jgi:hypothetical protein
MGAGLLVGRMKEQAMQRLPLPQAVIGRRQAIVVDI